MQKVYITYARYILISIRITMKGYNWSVSSRGKISISNDLSDFTSTSVGSPSDIDDKTLMNLNGQMKDILAAHIK